MMPAPAEALERTTHRYCDHQPTTDCANDCGAAMGPYSSRGPDPFGECPNRWTKGDQLCKVCGRNPQPFGRPSEAP